MSVFEYHNNTLGVFASVLYDGCGFISYDSYKQAIVRRSLLRIRRACRGKGALIMYDSLPQDWQRCIIEKFGDPYTQVKYKPFEDDIKFDPEATSYFREYIYDGNKRLSFEKQRMYCTNAALLNAFEGLNNYRKENIRSKGGTPTRLWENCCEMLKKLDKVKYPNSLPKRSIPLQRAFAKFKKYGFSGLVHGNYGNTHSEKLIPESREWLLSRWSDRVHKVADQNQLLREYNDIAEERGWKKLLSSKTIYEFLFQSDIQEMWWGHRHGELNAKEKFNYQHSTKLPTMRDSLWYSDGTKLNYFYLNDEGKVSTINVYEIMDAYSEVLIGYHISKTEDSQAQYSAYKMAVQFSGYKPYQLGFDNQGGHKKLTAGDFLSKIARLAIRTQPYNGKSKTIESAFNRFQSQYLKQDWFFTGQNIDAKKQESKANMEFILANQNNLPILKEIKDKYKQRRDEWNNAPHPKTGISRLEMYLNSHNPATPKIEIWDMVEMFWILREKPVMYNAYGLTFTEKKRDFTYTVYNEDNLPDMEWHRKNIDKKFYIKFDPEDMSLIYLHDKDHSDNLRFVTEAYTKVEIVRGKQEQTTFDHQYIAAVKKINDAARIDSMNKMDALQKEQGMHVESYGLNVPKIKGVNSSKKHLKKERERVKAQKEESYGEFLKEQSELMPVLLNKDKFDDDYFSDPTKYM